MAGAISRRALRSVACLGSIGGVQDLDTRMVFTFLNHLRSEIRRNILDLIERIDRHLMRLNACDHSDRLHSVLGGQQRMKPSPFPLVSRSQL